jgi:hypothetical protein
MANPLVRQLGLKQLLEREAEEAPQVRVIEQEIVETSLAGHIRLAWQRNKTAKVKIDEKLLQCLRARRGVFSSQEIATMQQANGGMNMVWVDLTETKCRAASAWIREIVLPVGEQPWGVDPTPLPDMPRALKASIVNKALAEAQKVMVEVQQAGGGVMERDQFRDLVAELGDKLRDDAEKTYTRLAKKRAKRMERTIADRLAQGGYQQAVDDFVEDFVTYPAAVLKGPIYRRHKTLKWGDGWTPKVSNNPAQSWERVSPFDIYPAPSSRSPQDGDFIERIRFRREELYDLKGLPGYKDDQIDQALRDYSAGHLEGWLWTESERQRLEQETLFMYLSPPGVIDALNYWGSVPGWKLMAMGMDGLDATREYECNVLLCGRFVLYAAINPDPLGQRPYRKACYDEIPGAFWGRSIPDLAATCQKMCNAAASALADNMAIASGPQIWVHADRFADGEQTVEVFPWKLWQLKSDPTQGVNPGIGFFQPPSNAAELQGVLEKWEIKADDATGIPRYTYGNERAGGSADTATGLSMLMNNAAKGLRRAIGSIDLNVIAPTINDTFTNEMLYNPDESIKGDCIVVPRGAAAILIRESAQQRRLQFLQMTANPIDAPLLGGKARLALLRETAAAMELPVDEVVPTDEEFEKTQAAQAEQQQAAIQAQMQADQAKLQLEHQFEMEREAAITQRDSQRLNQQAMADVVKQAVQTALQAQQATPESGAGGKKPRKLAFKYGDDGLIAGAEETDE